MKDKFLIGELAKIFNTTTDTLRHYDKMNLLKPDCDEKTNYRYYDIVSMFKLSRILFLKNLNISLSEIENYMTHKNEERLISMLKNKSDDIDAKIQQLTNLQHKIQTKLTLFEQAKTKLNEITVETIDERYGIYLKTFGVEDSIEVKEIFKRNEHYLKMSSWLIEGQVHTSLAKDDMENGIFNQFRYFVEVKSPIEESNSHLVILPKGQFVCTTFKGPYSDLAIHYRTLVNWISVHGYAIAGDSIENNIVDRDYADSADDFITEIQIPIE